VSNLAGLRPEAVSSGAACWVSQDIIVRAIIAPNPKIEALIAFIVLIDLKLNVLVIVSKFGCKVTIFPAIHKIYSNFFLFRGIKSLFFFVVGQHVRVPH
jgi:hypothetical protein